ncbi:hypothetical protein [Corynebacterium incognita]|nr:hypothetical protein [Corynebacterium incognita]
MTEGAAGADAGVLANNVASVLGLVGLAFALMLLGAVLVLRRRGA